MQRKIFYIIENSTDSVYKSTKIYKQDIQNLLGNEIVDTKIIDIEKNLLEHPFINPIIHSGEFTISMAYDIMNCAMNMAIWAKSLKKQEFTHCRF